MRLTIKDLEAMRTHELAELLANFVLLLRRLPDVPFSELGHQAPASTEEKEPAGALGVGQDGGIDWVRLAHGRVNGEELPGWAGKE